MVNFGKKLVENRFEPWAEHYLDYQGLKRCLERAKTKKRRPSSSSSNYALPPPPPSVQDGSQSQPQQQQEDQDDWSESALGMGSPSFGSPSLHWRHPHHPGSSNNSTPHQQQHKIQVEGTPAGDHHGTTSSNTHNHQQQRHSKGSWSDQLTWSHHGVADSREFETFLEDEVEKIGLFFLQIQGELAQDIAALRQQQKSLGTTTTTGGGGDVELVEAATTTSHYYSNGGLLPEKQRNSLSSQRRDKNAMASLEDVAEEGVANNSNGAMGAGTTSAISKASRLQQLYSDYHSLALLLLQLVHFVEFNVTGIRKILKKYDKNTHRHLTYQYISFPRKKNPELKHLWTSLLLHQYEGITALFSTLKVALVELKRYEQKVRYQIEPVYPSSEYPPAPDTISNNKSPIPPMTSTATSSSDSAYNHQKHLSMPNIPLTSAELSQATAAAGTLISSTGVPRTQPISSSSTTSSYQRSFTPQALSSKKMYDQPVSQHRLSESEYTSTARELDAVLLKVEAARKRLDASSNNFQDMLAAQIIMEPDMESGGREDDYGDYDDDEEGGDQEGQRKKRKSTDDKWLSHLLNLGSTFFYMTNYYVVAPTSGHYAKMLGGDEALAGIIIGMTPIAALVSTVLYSWWTSHSYKAALVFASTCSLVGNICYALALPCNSLSMVMIGRLLNGFGSARSINRRYIADTFPPRERTVASAHFVTAGALGMAAGPALASLLHIGSHNSNRHEDTPGDILTTATNTTDEHGVTTIPPSSLPNVWWTPENAPGWFMFVVWTTFLILLLLYFEDPLKHPQAPTKDEIATKTVELTNDAHDGEKQALLQKDGVDGGDDIDKKEGENGAFNNNMEDSEREQELPLWKNVPVMTTFVIYFVLKLVLECLLSSTSILTSYYFDWDSSISGIYLAVLGLLMLPANLGIATLARNHDDRWLIVFCEIFMLIGCLGIIQYASEDSYSPLQYIFFSIIIFLSTNALEGPNMSLLSQTIPKSWSRGIFNVGLLATESGTFGRAIGDVLLSMWSFHGMGSLLNDTFRNMSLASGVTLGMTYYFFGHMESHEKDD